MNLERHLGPICKGAAVGLLVGLATIFTPDHRGSNRVILILSRPVEWLAWLAQHAFGWSDGRTAMFLWVGLGIYWMILGALIAWGLSALHASLTGDDE